MRRFVKHFIFWTVVIVVVALSIMTGLNAAQKGTGNAVIEGLLVLLMIVTVYFVYCEIIYDEKPGKKD